MVTGGPAGQAIGPGTTGATPIFSTHGNSSFEIVASPGDHLWLATVCVQPNDWSYALQTQALFDAVGQPTEASFTHAMHLSNAGPRWTRP